MTKWLIVSVAWLPFAACSGDATGPKDSGDAALRTAIGFCTAWGKAACNSDVVDNCDEIDKDHCVQNQSAFCETLVPTGYTSKRAQECIDAVKAAYADAELDATELDTVLRLGGPCSHLVAGPSTVGESCSTPSDCDTVHDYTCVIKAGDETGTCQVPVVQANGEPCDAPAQVCNPEAYCNGSDCLVRRPTGKSCMYDAMCEDGDLCDIPTDSTDGVGTCAPKLPLKSDCTEDSQCASNICLSGTQKCTSKVVLTGESSICADL